MLLEYNIGVQPETGVYSQKRVAGGVGQSREPKLSVCCLHISAHPFLAKNRPGAPVFGHCPYCFIGTRLKNALAISQTKLLREAGVNLGRLSSLLADLRQRLAQLRRARLRRSAPRL